MKKKITENAPEVASGARLEPDDRSCWQRLIDRLFSDEPRPDPPNVSDDERE